ncbi:N-acetylmuramoyl-L-alanine amidase, partial [Burkholderia ubonensis]|uniref:peptidoglycan recognition protein family protein n=1 Tax=Burkholderia ubonensis TaxID=101571 RepID=UPI0012FA01D3
NMPDSLPFRRVYTRPLGRRNFRGSSLIDKDGTIYQTASLSRITNHVGKLQSRCIRTLKCSPTDIQAARRAYKAGPTVFHRHESQKPFPDRYPSNSDSIGIELVGMYYMDEKTGEPVYEDVTNEQNASLRWLIRELSETLDVQMSEVYRHPEVGRKNATEASTARWSGSRSQKRDRGKHGEMGVTK